MLASTQKKLEDEIVETLSACPNITATELHKRVQKHRRYSIQAIYKELKKLEVAGVVVKKSKHYSLRLPWVLSMQSLAQQVEERYILRPQGIVELPKKGKKQLLHFTNLVQLNNYWAQVLIHLMQQAQSHTLLTYMPHPWYHLIYTDQEEQYIQAVGQTGTKLYIINRSRHYLDRWAERFWKQEYIEYSFHKEPFRSLPSTTYLNCIDSFVLTAKIDKDIASDIEKLYTETSKDNINYAEIFGIFNQQVKATIRLERSEKKSKHIRTVFRRHFGIISI